MANMHVLGRTGLGYQLVCHVALPATTNTAGLAHRVAYARTKGWPAAGLPTVLPDGDGTLGTISAAEKATVTGTLPSTVPAVAEVVTTFLLPASWEAWAVMSAANKAAALDAWYAAWAAEWLAGTVTTALEYWGQVR